MKFLLLIFFTLIQSGTTYPSDGEEFFQRGLYQKAQEYYISEVHADRNNIENFFMLGNINYRLEDFSKARLYYFRALSLSPRDPDIIYNYNLTRKKLSLKKDSLDISIKLNPGELAVGALSLSLLLLTMLLGRKILGINSKSYRLVNRFVVLLLAVMFSIVHYPGSSWKKEVAVISIDESEVYSGTDSRSVALYKVPRGTLVNIKRKVGKYFLIKFHGSEQGWVKKETIFL